MRILILRVIGRLSASMLTYIFLTASVNADTFDDFESLKMGALGDSISTGFDASGVGDNFSLNWATGDGKKNGLKSHSTRLALHTDMQVTTANHAVAGSLAVDLIDQSLALAKEEPDYATILIGANDVCSWPTDYQEKLEDFKNTITEVTETLIGANKDVKILIVGLPNMLRLYELGKAHSCQFIWDITGVCKPLMSSKQTKEGRLAFLERIKDANAVFEHIAETHMDNVKYSEALFNLKFEWAHVSGLDCFHPSAVGHATISEETWKEGWYND